MSMAKITEAIESLGIEWRMNGYEPKKPPQDRPYCIIRDVARDEHADLVVVGRWHDVTVSLFEPGHASTPLAGELHDAFTERNVKVEYRGYPGYWYDLKMHETQFDMETYFSKEE